MAFAAASPVRNRYSLEHRHNFETHNRPQFAHTRPRFQEWTSRFTFLRYVVGGASHAFAWRSADVAPLSPAAAVQAVGEEAVATESAIGACEIPAEHVPEAVGTMTP